MSEKIRGSQKFLQSQCSKIKLNEKDLVNFVEMIEERGGRIREVFCYGIPAPEGIYSTISVGKEEFDKLSNGLLDLKELRVRGWEVFPFGIPVIDEVVVKVDIRRGY